MIHQACFRLHVVHGGRVQVDADDDWWALARELGVRLHRARVAAALTQEELAYTAGITRSHYQQLEKGQSRPGVPANPSLRTLLSLAAVLGVELSDLVPTPDAHVSLGRRSAG